jgi:hypothetical protein
MYSLVSPIPLWLLGAFCDILHIAFVQLCTHQSLGTPVSPREEPYRGRMKFHMDGQIGYLVRTPSRNFELLPWCIIRCEISANDPNYSLRVLSSELLSLCTTGLVLARSDSTARGYAVGEFGFGWLGNLM